MTYRWRINLLNIKYTLFFIVSVVYEREKKIRLEVEYEINYIHEVFTSATPLI